MACCYLMVEPPNAPTAPTPPHRQPDSPRPCSPPRRFLESTARQALQRDPSFNSLLPLISRLDFQITFRPCANPPSAGCAEAPHGAGAAHGLLADVPSTSRHTPSSRPPSVAFGPLVFLCFVFPRGSLYQAIMGISANVPAVCEPAKGGLRAGPARGRSRSRSVISWLSHPMRPVRRFRPSAPTRFCL